MSSACLFPGQGSQTKGMGGDLFARYPDWTSAADAILGYSIREQCLDDPREQLGLTEFTQPALFTVNALTWRARQDDGGVVPAFVAGHSLGEYNALVAANVFDFETALRLVKARGALMGEVRGGGMAAVLGLAPPRIEAVLGDSEAGRRLDVANFNSFDQTVIAGPTADLEAVKPAFDAAGAKRFILLNVSAPFHSRYMRPSQERFAANLAGVAFAEPSIPVIANVTARPYNAEALRDTLARQIGHSVQWLESMLYMMDAGVETVDEVGPGSVLTKLAAQIRKRRPA